MTRVTGPLTTGDTRTPMFCVMIGSMATSLLNFAGSSGTSFMWQMGQSPGLGRITHGCIPQV